MSHPVIFFGGGRRNALFSSSLLESVSETIGLRLSGISNNRV